MACEQDKLDGTPRFFLLLHSYSSYKTNQIKKLKLKNSK